MESLNILLEFEKEKIDHLLTPTSVLLLLSLLLQQAEDEHLIVLQFSSYRIHIIYCL